MSESGIEEPTKVAETYEELLVPALFGEWSPRLADAADIRKGQKVLDVACGTGILARIAAERVGKGQSVSGLDANPAMLAVAKRIAPQIEWCEGDAETLPFDDDSFDAVLCQFGLMLFSNPGRALREMNRVLKPGGRLAVAVFGSLDALPAYAAMAGVYDRFVNKSAGDALRMPFSMGDIDRVSSVLASADLGTMQVFRETGTARFSGVKDMVLSDVNGWFPFAGIRLDKKTIEAVTNEARRVLQEFQIAGGAVEFQVPVLISAGTKKRS